MTNLALIGPGQMGQNYLTTASKLPNISISCICAKTNVSLDQFPKKYIKLTNYRDIINHSIDGVIIATPSTTHFEIASFFLKKKIPILVEKPLTINFQDAQELLRIQKKTKTSASIGHTLLFHPAYKKLKQTLPKIGPIISLRFEGANNAPRDDTSVIYDWGSHGVAFFLDILDSKLPENIKALKVSKNPKGIIEKANIQLFFPKKITCNLIISWKSSEKKRKLTVVGEKGTLIFDSVGNGALTLLKSLDKKPAKLNFSSEKPLKLELEHFRQLIKGKSKVTSDLAFGVKVIKILSQSEQLFQEKN